MNIPIPQLKKWIAALDSGEYKQGRGRLERWGRYCPLGVGCKVLIPKNKQFLVADQLPGSFPDTQRNAPIWLKEINKDFYQRTGRSIVYLNDAGGYTFPEIATLLELVYVHKMLD